MTISLKADASGNSGSIQVAGVDRLTLNTDGSLVAGANPATGLRSMTLATMQKFADEFGASFGESGWQKLSSGLIIQWGVTASIGAVTVNVTFPLAFPTACVFSMATGTVARAATGEANSTISYKSKEYMTISSGNGITQPHNWIAIGY